MHITIRTHVFPIWGSRLNGSGCHKHPKHASQHLAPFDASMNDAERRTSCACQSAARLVTHDSSTDFIQNPAEGPVRKRHFMDLQPAYMLCLRLAKGCVYIYTYIYIYGCSTCNLRCVVVVQQMKVRNPCERNSHSARGRKPNRVLRRLLFATNSRLAKEGYKTQTLLPYMVLFQKWGGDQTWRCPYVCPLKPTIKGFPRKDTPL